MNAKIHILAGWMLVASAIGSRAVQTEIVYPGYNFLTCQVQSGTVQTVFDFTTFPAQASDPAGPPGGHNWVLYYWNNAAYNVYYYFTAADATTWEGIASPAGWYDVVGNYANLTLNDGQGFVLFAANANFLGNIINLTGSAGTGPPSSYSLPNWDLRGSPTTLYATFLAPAAEWAAMVTGTAPDGVAMYVYKGKPFNLYTTPFSPQGFTVFYYDGGWVPSGPYDTIAYPNRSIFVGPCPPVIEGTVYNDPAGSCSGTVGLANWLVTLTSSTSPDTAYGITDNNGKYSIIVPSGTFTSGTLTVAPVNKSATYWNQSTCSGYPGYTPPKTFTGPFSKLNDFYEQPQSATAQHVSVDVVSFPPYPYCTPCCGGPMTYEITYVNDGNADISSSIELELNLPAGVTVSGQDVSSEPGVSPALSISTPSIRRWNVFLTTPNVGKSFYIRIPVTVNAGGCSPSEVLLNAYADILPPSLGGPSAPLNLPVTCSQDPNYLRVTPQGCGSEGLISAEQELTCYIEFQNTNAAAAYDVVVSNTLPAGLDPSTVNVIGSSSPNVFQINGPQLVWTFPAIRLPSLSVDDLASRGYVKYTVKPFASDPAATVITNQAAIYFDLNPPILTQTITNTIAADPLPVAAFTVSPRIGSAGYTNDFTYTGGSSNALFLWNFGADATPATSTNPNPTGVVFASGGNHQVTLQVSLGGCQSDPAFRVLYAGEPVLNAQPAGSQLSLYWQGDGFHLQETAALNPGTTWMASSVTNAQFGSYFSATAPIGSGTRFYRLSQVAP